MADFTQDFYTSRRNRADGSTTYVGQFDRLWYDSITNTIRIGDGTAGGRIVADSSGSTLALNDISDVNVGTPGVGEDGYALVWDNTSGTYILQATGGAETDPVFTASPAFGIASGDITNWDTAHGWGDHSIVGYALTADINLEGGIANQVLVKQSGTDNDYVWEDLITYEPKYIKEIDDVSVARTTYLGEADPDTLQSAASWRIQEIIFDNKGGVDSVRFASGSSAFSFVWDDRLTYVYS